MINNRLKDYFPIIREREDIRNEINNTPKLYELFSEWNFKAAGNVSGFLQWS